MRNDARAWLLDIQQSALDLLEVSTGKTLADYTGDKWFRYSIERCFMIAGEAMNQLRKIDPALTDRITEARSIISFRNLLVHSYGFVDHPRLRDSRRRKDRIAARRGHAVNYRIASGNTDRLRRTT